MSWPSERRRLDFDGLRLHRYLRASSLCRLSAPAASERASLEKKEFYEKRIPNKERFCKRPGNVKVSLGYGGSGGATPSSRKGSKSDSGFSPPPRSV